MDMTCKIVLAFLCTVGLTERLSAADYICSGIAHGSKGSYGVYARQLRTQFLVRYGLRTGDGYLLVSRNAAGAEANKTYSRTCAERLCRRRIFRAYVSSQKS